MSILRALAINSLLSLFCWFCLLHLIQASFWRTTPRTTTQSTLRPFTRTPGLSLPVRDVHPPKCMREVPAIFFQYEKDIPIVGNSTLNTAFNVIEVCCPGYKRYDFDWSKCVPDCGEKCEHNGFCMPGGVCKCFDDFVLNHRNECVPTCPLGCPHGQCYLNGTCVCHYGYDLDPTKKYCVPYCYYGCAHNEICVEPNKCECEEGYMRSIKHDSTMGCQPVCIPDCGYGHCVRPNQCECFPGTQQRLNSHVCEYSCYKQCENGFCTREGHCLCPNGYYYDFNITTCLPNCEDNCENGVCISPGVCRCFNGYVHNGTRCTAVCERGCSFYGKCIAPNVCGCAIVDGPLKSYQKCELGICNARGRCRCQEGTQRFIDQCLQSDKITTYASMHHRRSLNESLGEEFNLLIGRHFFYGLYLVPRYVLNKDQSEDIFVDVERQYPNMWLGNNYKYQQAIESEILFQTLSKQDTIRYTR